MLSSLVENVVVADLCIDQSRDGCHKEICTYRERKTTTIQNLPSSAAVPSALETPSPFICVSWGHPIGANLTASLAPQIQSHRLPFTINAQSKSLPSHQPKARIRILKHNINVTIEKIREKWWEDCIGPVLKRIPQREQIMFAVPHSR